MGDKAKGSLLRLVDDPVLRTLQMLRQLPLESAAATLEMTATQADRLGLLSPEDRGRIDELIGQILSGNIDRAA